MRGRKPGVSYLAPCPWKMILRRKRVLIVVLVLSMSAVVLVAVLYYFNVRCSFDDVEKAVDYICKKYLDGKVTGDLCRELCVLKSLVPTSCIPNHFGKDVVFIGAFKGKKLVVKSSHLQIRNRDQVYWINDTGYRFFPPINMFYDMLNDSIRHNLDIRDSNQILSQSLLLKMLWTSKSYNLSSLSNHDLHLVMQDLWNLVQQPEYLRLKYHQEGHIFPNILGSCGHFYAEEYVEPLDNFFLLFYPAWRHSFSDRAKLALQILLFLQRLNNSFPNLHLCDIKMGHFGIDNKNNIKLLDMDMVYNLPNLIRNIVSVDNCTKDEDCSFLDCSSSCNVDKNVCKPVVLNTNFQRVCKNIFAGQFASKYLGLLGLPPQEIQDELKSVLSKCSLYVRNFNESDVHLANQLQNLLESNVQ